MTQVNTGISAEHRKQIAEGAKFQELHELFEERYKDLADTDAPRAPELRSYDGLNIA